MTEELTYRCDVCEDTIKRSVDGYVAKEKEGVVNFEIMQKEKVDLCPSCLKELKQAVSAWFPGKEM